MRKNKEWIANIGGMGDKSTISVKCNWILFQDQIDNGFRVESFHSIQILSY